MFELSTMQTIAVWALPVLFAITLHEAAHGWVAAKLGDKTALMLGRVTLNPFKHIDPIGTILVPIALLVLGGFVFGWAKAVPISQRNFRRPQRDMAWVAIAGPAANLVMALGWLALIKVAMSMGATFESGGTGSVQFLLYAGVAGVTINLVLMILNLLPLPPLDGSRVLAAFLPPRWVWQYYRLEPYGIFILLGLLFLGILGPLITGPFLWLRQWMFAWL
ncbi:site-2 protease family protein [Hydrogenovibrio halophilus]|uniref:site-2 protease family protein n=1 Tax=Hydrogenovibrio halophilus TaxID=373391 RepID=UPI00035F44FE|nr:site-2 protease family protein [Hydrogenovibrio halophilus]